MSDLTLFDSLTPESTEPDIVTDEGRILAALRWAHETHHVPDRPDRDRRIDEPPPKSVSAAELKDICIDYRARISGLKKKGHQISAVSIRYKDWRDNTRRLNCWRLTAYEQQLPPDYEPDTQEPF